MQLPETSAVAQNPVPGKLAQCNATNAQQGWAEKLVHRQLQMKRAFSSKGQGAKAHVGEIRHNDPQVS